MAAKSKKKSVKMSGISVFCAFTHERSIDEVKPNPRNPNKHPDEQIALLARIIKKQGWRSPIVVSTLSGLIVKGHGRYEAARVLKVASVPVDYQHYDTPQQEYADMIADNRIAEFADLSTEALTELVAEMSKTKFDLSLTALTQEELNQMLGNVTLSTTTQFIPERWAVVIDCEKESEQQQLLEELTERGLKCRALIS